MYLILFGHKFLRVQVLDKQKKKLETANDKLIKQTQELTLDNEKQTRKAKAWHKKYNKVSKRFITHVKNALIKHSAHYEFVDWLAKYSDTEMILDEVGADFGLLYIMSLLYLEQTEQSEIYLKKYIAKFGLDKIEYFLSIADLAFSLGYHSEVIDKSAAVYRAFQENEQNNTLKELLAGKTIAIVGNSPCQLGKGLGAEIDSHDIVIRMNNYQTKGFEEDYGSKTTIYARGAAADVMMRDSSEYEAIIVPWNVKNLVIATNSSVIDLCYEFYNSKKPIFAFSVAMEEDLYSCFLLWATTGLRVVWIIYRTLGNLDKVDFYGFNFLNENPDRYATHYFNDRSDEMAQKSSLRHHLSDEATFMKTFIDEVKNK